jgi:hypothetical protein
MTPEWLGLLNSIMRDVSEFAATGDYRLAGALQSLSSEARRAARVVRAARPRRVKRLVSLVEQGVQL